MLAPVVLREPCDGVILTAKDPFGHECIMVCPNRVKRESEAEFHQANAIPNECLVQFQGPMRPRSEEADGMAIYLETMQELDHAFGLVLIFLPFGSSAPSECIMCEPHGFAGQESTPVDLLEILYIDSGVVLMETKKWLIP